ncbi:armadillo repeat protein [Apiospora marii]|uniref:armadillo repeat protein n=1 Tax=Apiospora marii TaxID=335849 RepID=UPI003131CA86
MAVDIALLSTGTLADQLAALRALKHDIIGHINKKQQWIRSGILPPLVSLVRQSVAAPELNGNDIQQQAEGAHLDDTEAVQLHAMQLLASFANAGYQFLSPLHASGAIEAVLARSCLQSPRPQIVLTALRILRSVTEAAAFAPIPPTDQASRNSQPSLDSSFLANIIFANDHLESFASILKSDVSAQVSAVASLIIGLCREERHQFALVHSGVLDALATQLASFAVAEGQVIPRAEEISQSNGLSSCFPAPARPGVELSDILGSIAAIITDSPYRTCRLLYSPSILAVFPNTDSDWDTYWKIHADTPDKLAGLRPTKHKDHEPMDLLLPYTPIQLRGLSSHSSRPGTDSPPWTIPESTRDDSENPESPLVPWLIGLVRSYYSLDALAAASVLASLFKCGFTYRPRETTLGLSVVPKLLQILGAADRNVYDLDTSSLDSRTQSTWAVIERVPSILTRLITDSDNLQKATFDSGAVKSICKLLKGTYDAEPPSVQTELWSPDPDPTPASMGEHPTCQLGQPGQHPQLVHRSRLRESSLKALGALGASREEFRKAIVDQDLIPYIKESLYQFPVRPRQSKEQSNGNGAGGQDDRAKTELGENPTSVIVAACYATRMLARSVSILRTSLMDNAVEKTIEKLLLHHEVEVQVAATAVVCNMVTDFSPMKESFILAGHVKTLCKHAKSQNAALRLNAIWALNHLVHASSIELKKNCLEELQPGWLIQIICDDMEDAALSSTRARGDGSYTSDEEDDMDIDDQNRESSYKPLDDQAALESRILRLADARLRALRELELNPVRKARKDDLEIQEKGLGFIRNLIGEPHLNGADSANDTTEMIDHLFNTLGQDRFFEILSTKLKTKTLNPFGRRGATGEARVLYPQAKIIEAVVYILVHLAASIPRHRQLVISQKELLKLLAGLTNSQEREVRVALCHLINNLTWRDDDSDAPACSQRAFELKKLGFLNKLESLGQNDEELDVRERAKTAVWQMKHPQ